MNNLTVDHHPASRLAKPRKSVIGKLERSSFQAQRLSDVGIAFSQQITAKVGLKLPASQERIVEQTRWLYLRYVFVKLRQNRLPLKDLNLTKGSRARRAAALTASANESQIVISLSVPPSADALTLSDQRPLFTRQASIQMPTILSADLDSQDLSLLNARMNSRRSHRLGAVMPPEIMTTMPTGERGTSDEPVLPAPPPPADLTNARRPSGYETTILGTSKSPPSSPAIPSRLASHHHHRHTTASGTPLLPGPLAAPTPSTVMAATQPNGTNSKKYIMDPTINNQILTVIMNMIKELREQKPEFYGDTIYEVIGLDKFSSLESLLDVQRTICQEMTRTDISWDRIVALFSLFGAMSLDCVRLGAPEHVGPILDGFIGFVERDLALWISQQGGWESFLYKFRADYQLGPLYKAAAIALPLLLALLFAYN